jgi:hypothetical protein
MKITEMDSRLRSAERSGDKAQEMKEKLRAGVPTSWYRACTVCKDWKSHPQIVYPIKGGDEESGPIGAFQVDGYWVEMCLEEHQKYDSDSLEFASNVLHNPKPL